LTKNAPLTAIAQALRAIAEAIEAQAPQPKEGEPAHPVTEAEVIARRPGVSAGWLHAHVAATGRGARRCRLYRLADVDSALAASPIPPRPRKCRLSVDEEDPLEAMLRSGELVARGGQQ